MHFYVTAIKRVGLKKRLFNVSILMDPVIVVVAQFLGALDSIYSNMADFKPRRRHY